MKSLSQTMEKVTVKKALIATAIFALLTYLIDFSPIGVAGLVKITGGPSILDFEHGYSVDKAYSMLEALGEAGRHFYLTRILPTDIFFPLAFMLFNISWISLFLCMLTKPQSKLRLLVLLPVVNMLCDWGENVGFTLMLVNYPERLETVCRIGSAVTHMKFTCVLLVIILHAVLLLGVCIKAIAAKVKK